MFKKPCHCGFSPVVAALPAGAVKEWWKIHKKIPRNKHAVKIFSNNVSDIASLELAHVTI